MTKLLTKPVQQKQLPKSSVIKVSCFTMPNSGGDQYLITQNETKGSFDLWRCCGDCYEKIATGDNPIELDKLIPYQFLTCAGGRG